MVAKKAKNDNEKRNALHLPLCDLPTPAEYKYLPSDLSTPSIRPLHPSSTPSFYLASPQRTMALQHVPATPAPARSPPPNRDGKSHRPLCTPPDVRQGQTRPLLPQARWKRWLSNTILPSQVQPSRLRPRPPNPVSVARSPAAIY